MGTTQYNQIPYPELTDPPDGPAQMKALADRVDQLLHTGVPAVQAGSFTGGQSGASSATATVTFPRTFTAMPSVSTNINSGIGATMQAWTRGINATTTGFTYLMFAAVAMTYSVSLQWIAALTPSIPVARDSAPPEEWHYVTATCHTPECPKDGEPVSGILIPDDPAAWGWTGITCGACGQPITDIVPS